MFVGAKTRYADKDEEMPNLTITDAAAREIGITTRTVLGARAEWTVSGPAGEAVQNVRWTISGPGHVVANYVATTANAVVTPFHPGGANERATWYWARRGRVTVTIKARIAVGLMPTYERTVHVDVDGPEVDWFGSVTDQVKVARLIGVGNLALTFGGEQGTDRPGIRWTARVRGPGAPGEFAFTQLMTINRRRVFTLDGGPGPVTAVTSNGAWVLDEVVHYPMDPLDDSEERDTAPSVMREQVELVSDDSPATPLFQDPRKPEVYSEAHVEEHFRTYLMWKPTGGIWIAVAMMEWFWKGTAVYDPGTQAWSLDEGDEPMNPAGKKGVSWPIDPRAAGRPEIAHPCRRETAVAARRRTPLGGG
jgi:hypothetical protein